MAYPEAVTHWYDTVYCPVVADIVAAGLLRDFPDRTVTDLYLWLGEHRARLEEAYGWDLSAEAVRRRLSAIADEVDAIARGEHPDRPVS